MSDKTFSYKGYCGSIEFSLDDGCLFGQILFVRDLVTYEAEKIVELKQAFEDAVDFYLDKCERENLKPDKPFSGSFNVRLTPELHRAAAIEAARIGTSLNDLVRDCIESRLDGTKTVLTINQNHYHYPDNTIDEPTAYQEEPEWQLTQGRKSSDNQDRNQKATRH
jgi:predicted HicB family RNase H-like nuclease